MSAYLKSENAHLIYMKSGIYVHTEKFLGKLNFGLYHFNINHNFIFGLIRSFSLKMTSTS